MTTGAGGWRGWRLVIVAILALLVLVACGSGDEAEPTPHAVTPTAPPQPMTLGDVVWTTEVDPTTQEPADEVRRYPNNAPAIIAAVPIGSVPAGAEITATWAIDGTEVPQATTRVVAEAAVEEGWVSFRFTRNPDRLFPLGVLSVTVSGPMGETTAGEVEITLP